MIEQAPADLVVVGHVTDAWGIRGGIKITPYAPDAEALLGVKEWWLDLDGMQASHEVLSAKAHGDSITAQLTGFADRNAAERLKGARVGIPRSRFPVLNEGEYYWVDLIGLEVVNEAGEVLGSVTGLMDNGAHQIFEVRQVSGEDKPVERLIPFVGDYVKMVDLTAKRVVVDWGLDY